MKTIKDKTFVCLLGKDKIQNRIEELAAMLDRDYKNKKPIFIGVLNGSFMFLAEIFKKLNIACELSFIKVKSYDQMKSTGKSLEIIGLNEEIKGRHVIIVEDIIDTGQTMFDLLPKLNAHKPASLKIITLLFKKEAIKRNFNIDYIGFEIKNNFVVGFGMDYDGFGRNINEILVLKE